MQIALVRRMGAIAPFILNPYIFYQIFIAEGFFLPFFIYCLFLLSLLYSPIISLIVTNWSITAEFSNWEKSQIFYHLSLITDHEKILE